MKSTNQFFSITTVILNAI